MRSLRKREAPGKRGCREPPRKKFAKWLAGPLVAGGMLLAGCLPGQSPGQNPPDAATPDSTVVHTQCITIQDDRTVNDFTTQRQERTFCDGELMVEEYILPFISCKMLLTPLLSLAGD